MNDHPYEKYISWDAWKILDQAINDLEKNQDLDTKTNPEYIVGYLIKCLDQKGLLVKSVSNK